MWNRIRGFFLAGLITTGVILCVIVAVSLAAVIIPTAVVAFIAFVAYLWVTRDKA